VVRLKDETLGGLEALLRWEHPQRGLVLPGEFIPVAEESGLIDRIGLWVIEQALRDAARWKDARPDRPPLGLGINVSMHQLHNRRFAEQLADAIDAGEIDPENIHLELDERVLRDDAEQIHRNLLALKRTGVRLVIHDFGTGDSSLTRLAELPIDAIKVDRRFVAALGRDADAGRIAQAVAATGHALGVSVVGLGAETVAQVDELRRLGCTHAQGLVYSAPLPAAEIARIVADESLLKRQLT
jgi:EAL domain-containing protein (putative c-di-GMP-specific phosphodiesterase class I)